METIRHRELRDMVATLLVDATRYYVRVDDAIFHDQNGHDFMELQAEARESAVVLARVSRIVSETTRDCFGELRADILALQPLLQAFVESYVLIGAAKDWDELRSQPLVSNRYLDILIEGRANRLLEAAAKSMEPA